MQPRRRAREVVQVTKRGAGGEGVVLVLVYWAQSASTREREGGGWLESAAWRTSKL